MELQCRFMSSPWGGKARVSCRVAKFCVIWIRCFTLIMTTMASGHCYLGARARTLLGCHRWGQAGSGRMAATVVRRWLVQTAVGRSMVSESRCNFYYVWDALYSWWTFYNRSGHFHKRVAYVVVCSKAEQRSMALYIFFANAKIMNSKFWFHFMLRTNTVQVLASDSECKPCMCLYV